VEFLNNSELATAFQNEIGKCPKFLENQSNFGQGPAPALSRAIEKELVVWITLLVEKGFPASWADVETAAIQLAPTIAGKMRVEQKKKNEQ
jgi:hypothetical protein